MNSTDRMLEVADSGHRQEDGRARRGNHASSLNQFLLCTGFLGAGFVLAIATMSFAQSYDPNVGSGNIAYVVEPDGGTTRLGGASGRVNEQGHAHMMKHGSELKPGSVLYRSNNKLYALNNDNQLQEGKFLADHVKGWVY
jgi:hypothetical protein